MTTKRIVLALSLAMAVTLTGPAPAGHTASPVRPQPPAPLTLVPGRNGMARPAPADTTPAVRAVPAVSWPAPGGAAVRKPGGGVAWAPGLPVGIGGTTAPVDVQMLDRALARRAGWPLLVRATRTDGLTGPATVAVRYSDFADAYGGEWARRLRLVRVPECALSTPDSPGCRPSTLSSANDVAAGVVTASVSVAPSAATAGAASGTLVALAAGPSSDGGDYTATDLKSSGSWSAGGSAGDFSWAYRLRTPPSLGGPEPTVTFGYSAQAVDGFTAATNAQPSSIGEGFGWHPGFIDRGYRSCIDEGVAGVGDLCWAGDNAVLSLNGRSSQLVYDTGAGLWRPSDDDGSRVEKSTGPDNGDEDGEYWKITTTDGMQYFFGLNRLPGWRSGTDPLTNSVSTCRSSATNPGALQQAHIRGVELPTGVPVEPGLRGGRGRQHHVAVLRPRAQPLRPQRDPDRHPRRTCGPAASVRSTYGTRQESGADTVFAGTAPGRGGVLPTVPLYHARRHLRGVQPGEFPGRAAGPELWRWQLRWQVLTDVLDHAEAGRGEDPGGQRTEELAANVDAVAPTQEFKDPGDGQAKILWLNQIQHCGLAGGELCLPPVRFNPTQKSNRVDRAGTTRLDHPVPHELHQFGVGRGDHGVLFEHGVRRRRQHAGGAGHQHQAVLPRLLVAAGLHIAEA